MLEKKNFYINGKWVGPKKPNDIMVVNPATEKRCAVISLAGKEDVNDAVLAAKEPFKWICVCSDKTVAKEDETEDKWIKNTSEIGIPVTGDFEVIKKNVIFFGNFSKLSVQQYEEAMDAVYRDSELMYGNMTRDLYYLGKALDKKYKFLSISYNIFMVGFIFTVTTFLAALFV